MSDARLSSSNANSRAVSRLALPAQNNVGAARQLFFILLDEFLHVARDRSEVGIDDVRIDVEHRLHVVVAYGA